MPQIQINGETFDVFIVRNGEAEPIPMEVSVAPRTANTTVPVNSTTASISLVNTNTSRKGISIYNNSSAILYLSYLTPATITNSFMAMQPRSLLMLDQHLIVTNAIYGVWSEADGTAQITEYV